MRTRTATTALVLAAAALLAGCAPNPPRAWERDLLARPEMAMASDPLARKLLLHTYTSKEHSSGDGELGAGGCGCN